MEINLNLLQQIILNVPNYIFWKDKQLVYRGCNNNFAQSLGFSNVSEVIGKKDSDMPWTDASSDIYQQEDLQIIGTGSPILGKEVSMLFEQGEKRILSVSKVPLYDDEAKIDGILGIYIDITAIKENERFLAVARDKAEAANQAKTEFIANMSHDIRTPLAGVIGMSEALEQKLEDPDRKYEASLLSKSGIQLLSMLNEILDDVRAGNAGGVDIQEETFDLYQCIQALIELESPTTTTNRLGLQFDIAPSIPRYIISDRKKIHHILLNLIGNAIKFTKVGHIIVKVKCLDKTKSDVHLQFDVSDTGIGIPKKLQKKVFERFFRIDPSYKGRYEGYGLGLHIVQSYVHLLGGHITLTSKEGVGTTFHFDLRCKIGCGDEKQSKVVNRPSSGSIIAQPNMASSSDIYIESSNSEHKDENTPHLLLVEDNLIALKVIESVVSSIGYTATVAATGEEALALAKTKKFDLIITDIGLPGISGNELTQGIRDWELLQQRKPTPIVGLTGHAVETAKSECIAAGMNDVFTKPINRALLREIAKQFIEQSAIEQPECAQIRNQLSPPVSGHLGVDLPNTEAELFDLDDFPIFDPKDGLKHHGNNLALLFESLKDFSSEKMQKDIVLMQEAYANGDWNKVENIAHAIKGGVSYLGTLRMKYACQYLERYYKANHRTLLDKLYLQLLTVNSKTVEAIKEWLDQYL